MYFILTILIVGFLVYAGGRETKYGGLGLLWRVAVGIVIVGVIGIGAFLLKNEYDTKVSQKIAEQQKEKDTQQFAIAQEKSSKINAAKNAYQIKWKYTDDQLDAISKNTEYYTTATPYHGTDSNGRDFTYYYHHIDYSEYCTVHNENECAIYGQDNGLLLVASPTEVGTNKTVIGTYDELSPDGKEKPIDSETLVLLVHVQ